MIGLTHQQKRLFDFIAASIEANGVAPSYTEMANHMGAASKSGIHWLLLGLEERGYIRRLSRRKRAIEVVRMKCPHCGKNLNGEKE